MKVANYILAVCWCSRAEVEIPVAWVHEGRTDSCDSPGCGPGCAIYDAPDDDPYDEQPHEKKVWKMNKFSPVRYNPLDDSTAGLPRRSDSVSLLAGVSLCACGCGDTPAGTKAKFCMGHDARLKGVLTRAHSAGVTIALVDSETGVAEVIDPLEYADRFSTPKVDWRQLVLAAAAKIAERRGTIDKRAAERRVVERAAADGAVKVGRWEKTDSVAAIYRKTDGTYLVEFVDSVGRIQQKEVDVA